MKASAAALLSRKTPPHTFTLGPGAWASTYTKRPLTPVVIGMRRLSADTYLSAMLEATTKADEYLGEVGHEDPKWLEAYDILFLHLLIGAALCSPEDVTRNYFGEFQDGSAMVGPAPSGEGACSAYFTSDGIARLYDELTVLGVLDNPVWPEATDEDLAELGACLIDGSFLAALAPPPDGEEVDEEAEERAREEANLRRLLGYVIQRRKDGRQPFPVPSQ